MLKIVKKLKTIEEKNKKLLEENQQLKELLKNQNLTINSSNNNSNNNINITQNIINVVLPHKNPSLDHLTDADYFNILGRSLSSIPLMIEKIHFNEDVPENHNIYIPNIKNKYAMIYNGKEWSLHNRDEIINNLITDNETRLEDWISREDIQEKYPTAFKRFESFLILKEKNGANGSNFNRIKEDLLLLLYNKRNMIIK